MNLETLCHGRLFVTGAYRCAGFLRETDGLDEDDAAVIFLNPDDPDTPGQGSQFVAAQLTIKTLKTCDSFRATANFQGRASKGGDWHAEGVEWAQT